MRDDIYIYIVPELEEQSSSVTVSSVFKCLLFAETPI